MMPSDSLCPACGAVLDSSDAQGLCVACLLGEAMEPPRSTAPLGSIGGYDLMEIIARGGMGIVYRARQHDPEREVALKALPGAELLSTEARQRFKIEAEAMARLDHPAILPIYGLGEEDGTPFFTMKLAAGGTLSARMGDYAGKWREIAELIAKIAEAAHYAHERGVLHRDLKPGNILFDENGQIQVSDFGLAKIAGAESDLTRTIALMGTPNYMAPELTRGGKGAATTACDVWSLGIMLYELLAGHPPFHGDNLATVLRQLNEEEPASLPKGVPRDLAIIVMKALQKQPERRYATAHDLASDLRCWLSGDAIQARTQPAAEQLWRWLRRNPRWAAVFILILGSSGLIAWRARMLSSINAEMAAKNQQLRQELAGALVEQAAARQSEDPLSRRPRLTKLLADAAALSPSIRGRSVAAELLALYHAEPTRSGTRYRDIRSYGEKVIPTADLQRRLEYKNIGSSRSKRLIRLTDIDAPMEKHDARWQRELDGASALYAELSDSGQWVAFPNGRLTELWDTQENTQLGVIDAGAPTLSNGVKVWQVDLHPTLPVLAWMDRTGGLWAWHFPDGERQLIGKPAAPVMGIKLSPAGDQVALSNGAGVEVWNIAKRSLDTSIPCPGASYPMEWSERSGILTAHLTLPEIAVIRDGAVAAIFRWSNGRCSRLACFPGSWKVMSVSVDNTALIWDSRDTLRLLFIGSGDDAIRTGMDGTSFTIGGKDSIMRHYRLMISPAFHEFDCPFIPKRGGGTTLRISTDGRLLLSATSTEVLLWDTANRRVVDSWEPEPGMSSLRADFAPEGSAILFSNSGSKGIQRQSFSWDNEKLTRGPPVLAPGTLGWRLQQTHPDGTRFLLAQKGVASLWEGADGLPRKQIGVLPHKDSYFYLSPRFTYGHLSASYERLSLFDGMSPVVKRTVAPETWAGMPVFSPDEKWLVCRSRDWFRLFTTDDWQERFKTACLVRGNDFGQGAFSLDSKRMVLQHHIHTLGIYDLPDASHRVDLAAPLAGELRALCFSPDGRKLYILTSGHRLYEWDLDALNGELAKLGLAW